MCNFFLLISSWRWGAGGSERNEAIIELGRHSRGEEDKSEYSSLIRIFKFLAEHKFPNCFSYFSKHLVLEEYPPMRGRFWHQSIRDQGSWHQGSGTWEHGYCSPARQWCVCVTGLYLIFTQHSRRVPSCLFMCTCIRRVTMYRTCVVWLVPLLWCYSF